MLLPSHFNVNCIFIKIELMGKKIAIIGGGNLGTAIAEGLLKSKFCKPAEARLYLHQDAQNPEYEML